MVRWRAQGHSVRGCGPFDTCIGEPDTGRRLAKPCFDHLDDYYGYSVVNPAPESPDASTITAPAAPDTQASAAPDTQDTQADTQAGTVEGLDELIV